MATKMPSVTRAFQMVLRHWRYQSDVRIPAQFPDLLPGIEAYLSWLDSLPVVASA